MCRRRGGSAARPPSARGRRGAGGLWAAKQEIKAYPTRTNQIPRHVPPPHWATHPTVLFLAAGLLPFGTIFVELYFAMTSIWQARAPCLLGARTRARAVCCERARAPCLPARLCARVPALAPAPAPWCMGPARSWLSQALMSCSGASPALIAAFGFDPIPTFGYHAPIQGQPSVSSEGYRGMVEAGGMAGEPPRGPPQSARG